MRVRMIPGSLTSAIGCEMMTLKADGSVDWMDTLRAICEEHLDGEVAVMDKAVGVDGDLPVEDVIKVHETFEEKTGCGLTLECATFKPDGAHDG